jgi:YHS domain-containing protein
LRDLARLMGVMVDLYCALGSCKPARGGDARYRRHGGCRPLFCRWGHQQLALFNAHYDERCFLPIHVYDTAASRPVGVLLRPGKTQSGTEVPGHLRRLVRRIRRHWPATRITIRGDGHCGRPEIMKVTTSDAKTSIHDGRVYYFCSPTCRDKFEAAAASYLAHGTQMAEHSEGHHHG